ncbi:MAG: hypothetical protein K8M05_32465 [Deltaproteobacteria bacterium]|nr:hypothetical protein [Kofleriaceae bacterium]
MGSRHRIVVTAAIALALGATPATASTFRAERVIIVGRAAEGAAWTDAPTEARAGAGAELAIVIVGREGRRRVIVADRALATVKLGGRTVEAAERRDLAEVGPVRVQWSTVEPHGFRAGDAENGATSAFYSNVSTEPRDFGRWLGYDRIDYFERVIVAWSDAPEARRIPAAVTSGEPGAVQLAGLGTVRYKVEVELDGRRLATPGVESTDRFGLTRAVHRVSLRQGDDFMGWLAAYLLVPEVFGSAGGGANHQTERFTGADCADVMVGAMRRAGRTDVAYTNVAGLPRYATVVAAPVVLDDDGMPPAPVSGIRRGDLVRIDYGGALTGHTPRSWDHVAAVWEDRSDPRGPHDGKADGQLDGFDLVIHMGHPRLVIEPLAAQSPATIDVLRWKPKR